jgi:hypothetical protein
MLSEARGLPNLTQYLLALKKLRKAFELLYESCVIGKPDRTSRLN